ncbi:hypothetical protein CRYUN_Cryun13aG0160600 [Craigia yunnanensis]
MEMYRKIEKAEFRYPNWFPPEAPSLVSKMLDPNPNARISMSKIRGSSWFKKGLNAEQKTYNGKQGAGFSEYGCLWS